MTEGKNIQEQIIDYLINNLSPIERINFEKRLVSEPVLRKIFEEEKKQFTLENYVNNEMSINEIKEFEELIREDPQLLEEVIIRKSVNDMLEEVEFKNKLNIAYNLYEQEQFEEKTPKTPKTPKITTLLTKHWIKWAAVASIIAITIIYGLNHFSSEPKEIQLFNKYYEPKTPKQKMYINSTNALFEAKKKYIEGEYLSAYLLYESLPSTIEIDKEKLFYSALSLIEMGRYDDAIIKLNSIYEKGAKEYYSEVQWYLGLCYLKTLQRNKAIEVFQKISKTSSSYSDKALRIIEKLVR